MPKSIKNRGKENKKETNSSSGSSSSGGDSKKMQQNINNKDEVNKYVLWRKPIQTIYYFICELFIILFENIKKALNYKKTLASLVVISITLLIGFQFEGKHLSYLIYIRKQLFWYFYWIGLGIASSIGFGTGLHTFLLYLGPFIAKVTLAAYECNSTDFPSPPYPDAITCPSNNTEIQDGAAIITLWSIMSKVSSIIIIIC